jgi:hypothetical protein
VKGERSARDVIADCLHSEIGTPHGMARVADEVLSWLKHSGYAIVPVSPVRADREAVCARATGEGARVMDALTDFGFVLRVDERMPSDAIGLFSTWIDDDGHAHGSCVVIRGLAPETAQDAAGEPQRDEVP